MSWALRNKMCEVKCNIFYVAAFSFEGSFGRFIPAAIFCFIRRNNLVSRFQANHFSDNQSRSADKNYCAEKKRNGYTNEFFHRNKINTRYAAMQEFVHS